MLMAFGAAMDLLTMTIPNRISLLLLASFLVAAPLIGLSASEFLSHLGAGAIMLAAGIVLFAVGGFGGGDAKLLAAAGLWIGFDNLFTYLIYVSLFGGVLAVMILGYRSLPPYPLPGWAMRLHERGTGIPYGIAIAAGALTVFPKTVWFPALALIAS
ncbi:MAG: prepilin peptidase [Hyphomicrobium sp.]|jgi:prepilin peptidase CpaA